MRLVNLKRGAIAKPQNRELLYLEIFVADLTAALARPRGADGRFATRGPTHASNAIDPMDESSS